MRLKPRKALIVLAASISIVGSIWLPVKAQGTTKARPKSNRGVVVEFMKFISNSEHTYAQFKVTNSGSETVRYPGFAVNANCMILIKQGALIKNPPSIWGTHLFGTYSLSPGGTFVSDVQIPEEKAPFEIGFGYEVGAKHRWTIAWSGEIDYPSTAKSQRIK